MSATTSATYTAAVNAWLNKKLVPNLVDNLIFTQLCHQQNKLPEHEGTNVVRFEKMDPIAVSTAPRTQGTVTSLESVSNEYVDCTIYPHSKGIGIDNFWAMTQNQLVKKVKDTLFENAVTTVDTLALNTMLTTSNVVYGNGSAITSVNSKIALEDLKSLNRIMGRAKVLPFTQAVNAANLEGTVPTRPGRVAVISPEMEEDVRALTGFEDVIKYRQSSDHIFPGEIGAVHGWRFAVSTLLSASLVGATGGSSVVEDGASKAKVAQVIFVGSHGVYMSGLGSVPGVAKTKETYGVDGARKIDGSGFKFHVKSDIGPVDELTSVAWSMNAGHAIVNAPAVYKGYFAYSTV